MEDSNNVHHPKVLDCLFVRWRLSFTLIQVYQVSTGSVPQGSSEWHTAQLGQLVAVPSLKTNAPSELQGHRTVAHISYPTLFAAFFISFSPPRVTHSPTINR